MDDDSRSTPLLLGGLTGLIGVAMGAFGAHWAESRLSTRAMEIYETGVRYHLWHAVAMAALGTLGGRTVRRATLSFLLGIVLFSGSLYGLALGGPDWLGAVAPLGGIAYLVGWLFVLLRGLGYEGD